MKLLLGGADTVHSQLAFPRLIASVRVYSTSGGGDKPEIEGTEKNVFFKLSVLSTTLASSSDDIEAVSLLFT